MECRERDHARHAAARSACRAAGRRAAYYYQWLHHPPEDPFWNFAELRNKYGRTRAAVLNLSGWNDDNYGPEGAITNYLGLVQSRAGKPSRAALLVGPWVHGVDATARTKFGERDFGPAAAIDYDKVVLDWMDRYVRDDRTLQPADAVRYFVMGDNQWKSSDTWPPPGHDTIYYLSSGGEAPRRGGLTSMAPTGADASSTFQSRPDDPVINPYESAGAHDYQRLAERRDVLTFDSAPLERDTDVTGPIRARVYVSCDCRDTDLWVRLLDVAPDGAAFNLMSPGSDAVRASYRDLDKGRQLLTPGRVYELRLDRLVTSNLFRRGHRVGSSYRRRSSPTSRATSTPATWRLSRHGCSARPSACITTANIRHRCRCTSRTGDPQ